ncbi:MAG TPA: hypothetical protein VMZ91_11730 [Candidatus Paceibacterota bacterium]|nr:hypothetical protein [Candidatus Paceibacterota bacterium]
MSQILIYLDEEVEKKVKMVKERVKLSKSDIIQRVLKESFKEDTGTLCNIFISKGG